MGRFGINSFGGLLSAVLITTARAQSLEEQLEKSARDGLYSAFERRGRRVPELDPVLSRAARALALRALQNGAAQAGELVAVTQAISNAGGHDPSPKVIASVFATTPEPNEPILQRAELAADPSTHVGIGVARKPGSQRTAIVSLLVHRLMTLEGFPRKVDVGTTARLCGLPRSPYQSPTLFRTFPQGRVEKRALLVVGPPLNPLSFCAELSFPQRGRYQIELLAEGPRGPEVVALFETLAGDAPQPQLTTYELAEPQTLSETRSLLLQRINALRAAHEAPPLEPDPLLDQVAQAHSEHMSRDGFFAHVAPDGTDLQGRLRRVGYRYLRAGENLGAAGGPRAAHFGLEQSPAHRQVLLDPSFRRIGIGVAGSTLLTEVLAEPQEGDSSPTLSADPHPDRRRELARLEAYGALARYRRQNGLPLLRRSPELEHMAQEEVRALFSRQAPRPVVSDDLHTRVFSSIETVRSVSADVFITDAPGLVTHSQALRDAANTHVGIGILEGDSRRQNLGKYWVVVLYAAEAEEPPSP